MQARTERRDPSVPLSLTVEVMRKTDRTLIQLTGEIDIKTAEFLAPYFEDHPAAGTRLVVVDMSGIHFCGAAGIRQLLKLQQELDKRDVELRVVVGTPGVRRVFDALGLASRFQLHEDRSAALSLDAETQ